MRHGDNTNRSGNSKVIFVAHNRKNCQVWETETDEKGGMKEKRERGESPIKYRQKIHEKIGGG